MYYFVVVWWTITNDQLVTATTHFNLNIYSVHIVRKFSSFLLTHFKNQIAVDTFTNTKY